MKSKIIQGAELPVKFLYYIGVIAIPIIVVWSFSTLPTLSILLVFWLIFVGGLIADRKSYNHRIEISDEGLTFFNKKPILNIPWNQVESVSMQLMMTKTMGTYYSIPYLGVKVTSETKTNVDIIPSSKEYGFIRKKTDLSEYMSVYKMDLYINMKNLKEEDENLIDSIAEKTNYKREISPLVKTNSQQEYDKVVSDFFKK